MQRSKKIEIARARISRLQKAHGGALSLGIAYFSGKLSMKEERNFIRALNSMPAYMYATFQ